MVKKEKDISRCSGGILADDQVSGSQREFSFLALSPDWYLYRCPYFSCGELDNFVCRVLEKQYQQLLLY